MSLFFRWANRKAQKKQKMTKCYSLVGNLRSNTLFNKYKSTIKPKIFCLHIRYLSIFILQLYKVLHGHGHF